MTQGILLGMRSRLHDIPVIKTISSYVDASYYNQIRIALARLESPLRIELINLRGLDIVLDDKEWVCVDRGMGDLPTVAWTNFQNSNRTALHLPIACEIRFYHNHADLICSTVLNNVNRHLSKRLKSQFAVHNPSVSNLPTSIFSRRL